jgi:membrane peptidoglycan carboxypeptidase
MLVAALAAGVLVAGLLLPVVGGVGLVAKRNADSFENLPSELSVPPLAQGSRILAADGSLLATFYSEDRQVVPLSAIPVVMRDAIVAIEDSRFYEHHGVDMRGAVRAAVTNQHAGSVQQGGSTLTQQYVKNVLLQAADTPAERKAAVADTLTRKLREARYAIGLEQAWSKDKILESYLNIAYFGSGAYGVGSAALRYFDKPVQKLTLPEAALLAGLVRYPSGYNPILHPQAAKERRDTVLQRMADLGKISQAEADKAIASTTRLHVTERSNGCVGTIAPFFCDYVVTQAFLGNPAFGKTREERVRLLYRGGLTIRTSLDPRIQRIADRAIRRHVKVTDKVGAAANVVEPGTGLIKAMAVNRIFGKEKKRGYTELNYATGGTLGVSGGSTFKVFTLAAALEEGIPLTTTLHCPPVYRSPVFRNGDGSPYTPGNAEAHEGGVFNLFTATWLSVNTCFVQLEERTGTDRPASMAEAMGVRVVANGGRLNRGGSFTLGGDSISPLAMAGAYATFAAHGTFCAPTAIVSVTDFHRRSYPVGRRPCKRVLARGIADTVTSVLRGVITSGTGRSAAIGRPAAGKTGTAQNYSAAWFNGYTPQLAASVWLGDPRGAKFELKNVKIGGHWYSRVFGATISAPIWGDLMRGALKNKPVADFSGADPTLVHGRQVAIPSLRGLSPAGARARLAGVGLTGIVAAPRVPAGGVAGTVAYTTPGAGATIGLGSTVLMYLTNGTRPKLKPKPTKAAPPANPRAAPRPSPKAKPTKTQKPKPRKSPPGRH